MIPLGHHAELKKARGWRAHQTDGELAAALAAARDALRDLRRRFPYVLAVGHELVLVLEKLGDLEGATRELGVLKFTFPDLDAETLCRGGKIHKVLGLRAAESGKPGEALAELAKSARDYRAAFEVQPTPYSRLNELFARYYRAALLAGRERAGVGPPAPAESGAEAERVRREAGAMLDDPGGLWERRLDDDHIWLPASRGEAEFLARRWGAAAADYTAAMEAAGGKVAYLRIMRDQLARLLEASGLLGVAVPPPLADPDAFFGLPPRG